MKEEVTEKITKDAKRVDKFSKKMPRRSRRAAAPVAEIAIKGLGLLWFSNKSDCAVVGFLNIIKHDLFLSITLNEEGEPEHEIPIGKNSTVVFNSLNPDKGETLDSNDDLDFKHMIDITDIHGFPVFIIDRFFAKFFINNATHYTLQRSKYTVTFNEIGGNHARKDLDRVGKVGGAWIYDEDFNILIDDVPLDLSKYKRPYKITIEYQCVTDGYPSKGSDFKHIYNVVDVADDKIFEMEYDGDEPLELLASEAKNVKRLLTQFHSLVWDKDRVLEDEERRKIDDELVRLKRKTSCEVACQLVTLGEEVVFGDGTK
jgi:hypothetical protein